MGTSNPFVYQPNFTIMNIAFRILFLFLTLSLLESCSQQRYAYLTKIRCKEYHNTSANESRKKLQSPKLGETISETRFTLPTIPGIKQNLPKVLATLHQPQQAIKVSLVNLSSRKKSTRFEKKQIQSREVFHQPTSETSLRKPSTGENSVIYGALIAGVGLVLWLLEIAGLLTAGSGFLGLGLVLLPIGILLVLLGLLLRLLGL